MADNKAPLLTPKEKEMQIIPYDFKGKAIVPVSDPMDIDPPPKVKQVFFIRTFITIPEHIRNKLAPNMKKRKRHPHKKTEEEGPSSRIKGNAPK
jgi:hypothetical protein